MRTNAPLLFDSIKILYKCDSEYMLGYDKLKNEYSSITFYPERHFKMDLLKLIDENIEATTFIVDDAVIFRQILARKQDIIKPVVQNTAIFSLRLGKNCVYSHPANLYYSLKEHTTEGEYIIFDYIKQEAGDFRYPLSTDGHIFNTNMLKTLLTEIEFSNPNTLEANLQRFVGSNSIPTVIKCFSESKLVSVPVNLVNTAFNNRYGLVYGISEKELNDKYLLGEKIDMYAMDFSNINGPHKEIEYVFK